MNILLAIVAGGLGTVSRYLVSGTVQARSGSDFPIGTLSVNLSGAVLIGLVAGATDLQSGISVAVVGFLGGFTTFSTWMIETIRLGMPALRARAMVNLTLTLVAGVALTAAGYSLTN
ncbi:MAG TPA: CrcB family protein [Acidimicrobiia bacterium]|nr:CrcB family protein [Acidimicrobiia bacterium]